MAEVATPTSAPPPPPRPSHVVPPPAPASPNPPAPSNAGKELVPPNSPKPSSCPEDPWPKPVDRQDSASTLSPPRPASMKGENGLIPSLLQREFSVPTVDRMDSISVPRPGSRPVDRSPSGRYNRYETKLGVGAYKQVFLGLDTQEGKEVAWSTIKLAGLSEKDQKRMQQEAALLTKLKHKNILVMYDWWLDEDSQQLILVTSKASKTLKEHVALLHPLQPAMMKKMCRQILSALVYLHAGIPESDASSKRKPIIHRDLKCDNIFIDGATGNVKIGDFGLAETYVQEDGKQCVASMEGTLGFVAPELLRETPYNERVDIYAFGMCVLEMATNEYPFAECGTHTLTLLAKISANEKPAALERVEDSGLKRFIEQCLLPAEERPSAKELLENTYYPLNDQTLKVKARPSTTQDAMLRVSLRLCLEGTRKKIQFSYDITKDTPAAIAREIHADVLKGQDYPGLEAEIVAKLGECVKPATQKCRQRQLVELFQKLDLDLVHLEGLNRENVTIVDLPFLKEEDYVRLGIPLGPRRRLQQHLMGPISPVSPSIHGLPAPLPPPPLPTIPIPTVITIPSVPSTPIHAIHPPTPASSLHPATPLSSPPPPPLSPMVTPRDAPSIVVVPPTPISTTARARSPSPPRKAAPPPPSPTTPKSS